MTIIHAIRTVNLQHLPKEVTAVRLVLPGRSTELYLTDIGEATRGGTIATVTHQEYDSCSPPMHHDTHVITTEIRADAAVTVHGYLPDDADFTVERIELEMSTAVPVSV